MKLDENQTAMALGLAGAQAAGIKSMFGTMTKPLHAGKAAANGLLAARLAARGFTANPDVLETAQGFLATQTRHDLSELDETSPGLHIQNNLFKYHAACYLTHSSIEALAELRDQNGRRPDTIEKIILHVPKTHLGVCNIEEPTTGLEAKFSLRQCAALVLHEIDTAKLETYSDANATRPDLMKTRALVEVVGDFSDSTAARVEVALKSGETIERTIDVGIPATDLIAQEERLAAKFDSLAVPIIAEGPAAELKQQVLELETLSDISPVLSLCTDPKGD